MDVDFDEVQEALVDFNNAVNAADSEYVPGQPGEDPNNSNGYTSDALRALTGLQVENSSPLKLVGFNEPLDNVEQPEPLVHREEQPK